MEPLPDPTATAWHHYGWLFRHVVSSATNLLLAFMVLFVLAGSSVFLLTKNIFAETLRQSSADDVRYSAQQLAENLVTRPIFSIDVRSGITLQQSVDNKTASIMARQEWGAVGVERLALYNLKLERVIDIAANAGVRRETDDEIATVARNGSELIEQQTTALISKNSNLPSHEGLARYIGQVQVDGMVVGYISVHLDNSRAMSFVRVAVERTERALAISLFVGLAILMLPMYLSILANTREHRELIQRNTRLSSLATIDSLTQTYNRNSIHQFLGREFKQAGRLNQGRLNMAVMMIDIDHFKRVNDTYGHITGDEVLREVASRLKASVRGYDLVGRYGGEEFIVLLPHTDAVAAATVADRIWRSISAHPFVVGVQSMNITTSIGLAIVAHADISESEAIECADVALYQAKNSGRNRVVTRYAQASNVEILPVGRGGAHVAA